VGQASARPLTPLLGSPDLCAMTPRFALVLVGAAFRPSPPSRRVAPGVAPVCGASPRSLRGELRTLPAIASDSQLKEQQEGLVLDFENWSGPPDADGLKGPAVYKRAVLAGRLPDPRKKSS